jgi:cytochrome c
MIAYGQKPSTMSSKKFKFQMICLFIFAVLSACQKKTNQKEDLRPENSRFLQKVLVEGLEEPLQLEFDREGYVYWIERIGNVMRFHEKIGSVEKLGTLELTDKTAPGLVGILLDRDFDKNRQIFLFYSPKKEEGNALYLSRFELGEDDKLDLNSEKVVLSIPWEQPDGQHFGGGMTWDKEGNLYLSIGADSHPTQYSPLAFENEGGRGEDEARTAGNSNDLRGSIIRIRPRPDGTYDIPEGELICRGHPKYLT